MKKILLLMLLFAPFFKGFSQKYTDEKTEFSYAMLKYYSMDELTEMKINDTQEFERIAYYFKESFVIEKVNLDSCALFNTEKFDISVYEKRRSWDKRVTIDLTEKYCVKIILLSSSELKHKLTIHESQIKFKQ